jgi:hypothetical protein
MGMDNRLARLVLLEAMAHPVHQAAEMMDAKRILASGPPRPVGIPSSLPLAPLVPNNQHRHAIWDALMAIRPLALLLSLVGPSLGQLMLSTRVVPSPARPVHASFRLWLCLRMRNSRILDLEGAETGILTQSAN